MQLTADAAVYVETCVLFENKQNAAGIYISMIFKETVLIKKKNKNEFDKIEFRGLIV